MNKHFIRIIAFIIVVIAALSCNPKQQTHSDISPNKVIPSDKLLSYQEMELIGFIHFSINTFTNKEWGFGDESPELFNPSQLDVDQWVTTAKAGGLKQLILTAKHHDGFCLWPSKYTEHSIKNSPYKNGKGDIVDEFVNACRK
ncbi:MAG: alpha-L-fucosidase, partial [Bacteroidales bacterium]|nr:alpha-L-fucosidase [Bacteroidales bacterium]